MDAALIAMTGISISATIPWRILQNIQPSTIGIMRLLDRAPDVGVIIDHHHQRTSVLGRRGEILRLERL
jgi:hypothetical protein